MHPHYRNGMLRRCACLSTNQKYYNLSSARSRGKSTLMDIWHARLLQADPVEFVAWVNVHGVFEAYCSIVPAEDAIIFKSLCLAGICWHGTYNTLRYTALPHFFDPGSSVEILESTSSNRSRVLRV